MALFRFAETAGYNGLVEKMINPEFLQSHEDILDYLQKEEKNYGKASLNYIFAVLIVSDPLFFNKYKRDFDTTKALFNKTWNIKPGLKQIKAVLNSYKKASKDDITPIDVKDIESYYHVKTRFAKFGINSSRRKLINEYDRYSIYELLFYAPAIYFLEKRKKFNKGTKYITYLVDDTYVIVFGFNLDEIECVYYISSKNPYDIEENVYVSKINNGDIPYDKFVRLSPSKD